jgi:hypothetical protein
MAHHSVISDLSGQFSPEQIRSWSHQFGIPERSLFLATKGLVPVAWLLWEKRFLLHWTGDTDTTALEQQMSRIFQQNPAILPALSAFSGVPLSFLQNIFPVIIHQLSVRLSAQFQGKTPVALTRMFHLERAQAEVLLPATIRAVTPELQQAPTSFSPPGIFGAWMEGLFWLLLLGLLFYRML